MRESETESETEWSRSDVASLRLPSLHRPYLILVGLWGLGQMAEPFLSFATDGPPFWIGLGFVGVALIVHFLWLRAIVRDAAIAMAPLVVMGIPRLFFMTTLAASCFILPLWTIIVGALLLRVTQRLLDGDNTAAAHALARHAAEARHLFLGAIILTGIDWILLLIQRPETVHDLRPSTADRLGPIVAGATAALRGLLYGQYVWFASRATPALYRAWRELKKRRDDRKPLVHV